MRNLSRGEVLAAQIVSGVLGASWEQNDDGSQRSQFDIRVHLPDSRLAALEVTSVVNPLRAGLYQAMRRHGEKIESSVLQHDWDLWLDSISRSFRDIRDSFATEIVPELLLVESMDQAVISFDQSVLTPHPLSKLGIAAGFRHKNRDSSIATVTFLPPSEGAAVGAECVVIAAVEAATKSDNLLKLDRSGADENHLFVWVENYLDAIGFTFPLPASDPVLPPAVGVLWAAGRFNGRTFVWRFDRSSGWSEIEVRPEWLVVPTQP